MRRGRVVASAAMVVAIGLVVANRDEPASRRVDPISSFRIGPRRGPYTVTYRLDDLSNADVEASVEVVSIDPPFASLLESVEGDDVTGLQVADVTRLRIGSPDEPVVIARVPGPAPSDLRVAQVLDAGIDAGLIRRREQRLVAGRRCQVLRTGTLLGAGPLEAIRADDHADSCVDRNGILLEETLVVDGQATVHRRATKVQVGARRQTRTGPITLDVERAGSTRPPVRWARSGCCPTAGRAASATSVGGA